MRVVEIFDSIDGEGVRAGELTTFIRLAGCNLRCSYCDTPYALKCSDGEEMSINDIVKQAQDIGYRNITLTGGEPLLLPEAFDLIESLVKSGFYVNIETNGSRDISKALEYENVIVTMDYKTSDSGVEKAMRVDNFELLREQDILKFVVTESDLPRVKEIIRKYDIQKPYIYISPVFEKINPAQIVEFLKELHKEGINTNKIRVQLQIHKYIWHPSKRGV